METTTTTTTGVKYIGSKAALIPFILKAIQEETPLASKAIDVFTGTTRVAQAFKKHGLHVVTSDLSWASEVYSQTWIGNAGPNAHLQSYIDILNALEGTEDGWLTKNYCDVEGDGGSIVRVWQAKNGRKADAIRDRIETWSDTLNEWEVKTLICSLIFALDKVDNTVGVQQAYLKDWCKRSYNDLKLILPAAIEGQKGNHLTGDCLTLEYPDADFAYLDPPYSAHSYSSYYHIWDSIAKWDKPNVSLKTNRRLDRVTSSETFDTKMVSAWNSKKNALAAFEKIIDRLPVPVVYISYNNESLLPIESLLQLFKKYPAVNARKIEYKRNIMCQIGNATVNATEFQTKNTEYLFTIRKV